MQGRGQMLGAVVSRILIVACSTLILVGLPRGSLHSDVLLEKRRSSSKLPGLRGIEDVKRFAARKAASDAAIETPPRSRFLRAKAEQSLVKTDRSTQKTGIGAKTNPVPSRGSRHASNRADEDSTERVSAEAVGTNCSAACLVGSVDCNGSATESLAEGDCTLSDGSFIDTYALTLTNAAAVEVALSSTDFDALLLLADEDCNVFAANDDCTPGDFEFSCLSKSLEPGNYFVIVNSFSGIASGDYTLNVACDLGLPPCDVGCVEGIIGCDDSAAGILAGSDCTLDDGSFIDTHSLTLDESATIGIELASTDFDTFLLLTDADCNILASNDDCTPGNFDLSCLSVDLEPGEYFVLVNTFSVGETGEYTLSVSCETEPTPCDEECISGTIECDGSASGSLAEGDCTLDDGTFVDTFELSLIRSAEVTIEVASTDFDTFVLLADADCNILGANDDCTPGDFDLSCVSLVLEPGDYFVIVNSFSAGETGDYTANITCDVPLDPCVDCFAGELDCGSTVTGDLEAGDCALDDGSSIDVYSLEVPAGGMLDVELGSTDFDTFLVVLDSDCQAIAANDDCTPGNFDLSCLSLNLAAGSYFVLVNSFSAGETGEYALSIDGPGCSGGQIPGDCNQDGELDIADAICLVRTLFMGSPPSFACGDGSLTHPSNEALLDVNGSDGIDLADAITLISYQFMAGSPPVQGVDCVLITGCADVCTP